MTAEELSRALTCVDGDMIEKAAPQPEKCGRKEQKKQSGLFRRHRFLKLAVPAAAIMAAVVLYLTGFFGQDVPPSVLSVKAHALENAEPYGFGERYEAYLNVTRKGIAKALAGFSADSMAEILGSAEEENLIYSPLNTYMALSILAETAGGSTREEILAALHADSQDEVRERIETLLEGCYVNREISDGSKKNKSAILPAASVWLNAALEDSYREDTLKTLASVYHTSAFSGTMGSEDYNKLLREWTDEQTQGLLKNSIRDLSMPETASWCLMATLYYQAQWGIAFDDSYTDTWHGVNGPENKKFMNDGGCYADYYEGEHFVLGNKRTDNGIMWFFLPEEGLSPAALLRDEEALSLFGSLGDQRGDNDPLGKAELDISMPAFDIESKLELNEMLKALGMTEMFGAAADFSSLGEDLGGVDTVSQTARVIVDEFGVKAAAYCAATGAGMLDPLPRESLVLDRPFLFILTDQNGVMLFSGIVNEP